MRVHFVRERRPSGPAAVARAVIRAVVAAAVRPMHFFTGPALSLEWEHLEAEEIPWELFRGRLLERAQTTQKKTFEAWNIYLMEPAGRSAEPLLSVKLDPEAERLYVTRAVLCHAWEGYHAGGQVYLSRETQKWVRELVDTVDPRDCDGADALRDEIANGLFRAVVGVSRLPLTSLEAPLPAFSLGQLAYFQRPLAEAQHAGNMPPRGQPSHSWRELIVRVLSVRGTELEEAKLLEFCLRAVAHAELDELAETFRACWQGLGYTQENFLHRLRLLFDEVSLSPYTDFVDKTLLFLRRLVERKYLSLDDHVDFLGYLLRHLARHLTAYDLVTFHHQGANYPDALLLDAALKAVFELAERSPALFLSADDDSAREQTRKRLRRRALRQGFLLRRACEDLPVPDAPTTPGENARLLPAPHVRVPEEQILMPQKRTRKLFAGDPLTPLLGPGVRKILQACLGDLEHDEELRELGMALFLDRPLGAFKTPLEPDRTVLFSYEAFSRGIAERRLYDLCNWLEVGEESPSCTLLQQLLKNLAAIGIQPPPAGPNPKPGTVSLADVSRTAEDFVCLRTTRRSVRDFLAQFDFSPLARITCLDYLAPEKPVLILGEPRPGKLVIHDAAWQRRLELQVDPSQGYNSRDGQEYPVAGLEVLNAWDARGGKATPNK